MGPKVRSAPGPQLWKLVLQHYGSDPEAAMHALRLAGAGARTRAVLAIETWPGNADRAAALLTLRSPAALLVAFKKAGWDVEGGLEVPGVAGDLVDALKKRAGLDGC